MWQLCTSPRQRTGMRRTTSRPKTTGPATTPRLWWSARRSWPPSPPPTAYCERWQGPRGSGRAAALQGCDAGPPRCAAAGAPLANRRRNRCRRPAYSHAALATALAARCWPSCRRWRLTSWRWAAASPPQGGRCPIASCDARTSTATRWSKPWSGALGRMGGSWGSCGSCCKLWGNSCGRRLPAAGGVPAVGAQAARMAAQRDGRREGRRLRCLRRSSPRCTPCCANPWYLLPCTPSLRLRMYAFDVHCNAFFPCFLLLWVLQLPLCPLLLSHTCSRAQRRQVSAPVAASGCRRGCTATTLWPRSRRPLQQPHRPRRCAASHPPSRPLCPRCSAVGAGLLLLLLPHLSGLLLAALPGAHRGGWAARQ